ncbi:MAG: gliding motility-associated C-terminal domain-containing protein, partial [Chryseobacterium sp.]|nr:gliding motility-associated C-terminal domain-containing protein [Chryseobacterium sp.]
KLEILTQPYNGKVTTDNLNLKYVPNISFTGDDRFVYRICTSTSGLCETIKANVFVNEKPHAEIISELYPISESAGKGKYDLTKVIINQGTEKYEFYEDSDLKKIIQTAESFETNLLKAFVKITSPSGCFIVKEIKLLVLEENIMITNFLSPNGDGTNDFWDYSKLSGYSDLEIFIYNKFGTKVFEHSKTISTYSWNGRDASGKVLPTDNYWAILNWKNSRTGMPIKKQMWIFLKNR